jgi:carbonic anhydrase
VGVGPDEALALLEAGNERFASGTSERRDGPVARSSAFATVLTCVDPRVAPEIVFDVPLGRLFVVRVAGNVAGELETGSIDLAVALGTPLVVVLGHTDCKAIERSLTDDEGPLLDRIREHATGADPIGDNARGNADVLRAHLGDKARVVAAVYDVVSGVVSFAD